jgi:hypothetical protein
MLAYEIQVTGGAADADAERVRQVLEASCGEPVDGAVAVGDSRVLLIPSGVEWTFERLRALVMTLREAATEGSVVTFCGQPDDQEELVRALVRQARVLAIQGRSARARTLLREALPLAAEGLRHEVERALGELDP